MATTNKKTGQRKKLIKITLLIVLTILFSITAEAQIVTYGVGEQFCDIRTDTNGNTHIETTHITVSDFDPNTEVQINISLYDFNLMPANPSNPGQHLVHTEIVHTDGSGSATFDFTPNANSDSGVGTIIATQVNNNSKQDAIDDWFVIEKIVEGLSGDGIMTFQVYYFSANFNWDINTANDFAQDSRDAAVTAYDTEITNWNFVSPDPDHRIPVYISDGVHLMSAFYENSPVDLGTHCHSGDGGIICVQSNLDDILANSQPRAVRYATQEDTLNVVIAHEHFHNIQYGYNEWKHSDT